jgi:uncharacterized membrane protein YhfC
LISDITIVCMIVSIGFAFFLFGGLVVVYRKKEGVSIKPLILGSVGFIFFSQLLEKALHVIVLSHFPHYTDHPVWFGLYGGFAAGFFEETGRFILFTWLLKKYHNYRSGISFGIGWGGAEAVLLTLTVVLPNLIFTFMINSGTLELKLGSQVSADAIHSLKEGVLSHGAFYYLLGCMERFFAIFIQIFLSVFVLWGVVKRKSVYLLFAVIIHAAIDFPIVFFQTGKFTQLWIIELYIAVIGFLALFFANRLKRNFS